MTYCHIWAITSRNSMISTSKVNKYEKKYCPIRLCVCLPAHWFRFIEFWTSNICSHFWQAGTAKKKSRLKIRLFQIDCPGQKFWIFVLLFLQRIPEEIDNKQSSIFKIHHVQIGEPPRTLLTILKFL